MKAWEALALGRHMILPLRGTSLTPDGKQGCALGMIELASGGENLNIFRMLQTTQVPLPCGCSRCACGCNGRMSAEGAITHVFDHHVMTVGDWTIERMIDWLREVEGDAPVTESAEVEEAVPVCR